MASWSRKPAPGFGKPVGRTVARVSVEEHMANYRAARALLKGTKKSAVKIPVKK